MANSVGLVIGGGNVKRSICLMTAQTANVAAPTLATDGIPAYPDNKVFASASGAFYTAYFSDVTTLTIVGTGTTPSGIFTLWGYLAASSTWFPIQVNAGAAVTGAALPFIQTYGMGGATPTQLGHFDRLALQLGSISGTGATFEAFLTSARAGS